MTSRHDAVRRQIRELERVARVIDRLITTRPEYAVKWRDKQKANTRQLNTLREYLQRNEEVEP